MKRLNSYIALACALLFFLHGVTSALFLMRLLPFSAIYKRSGWLLFILLLIHAAIGIVFMTRNIVIRRRGGFRQGLYAPLNAGYIGQRVTGLVLLIFSILHIGLFGYTDATGYHLKEFNNISLFIQLALTASAAIHILFSVKPALITVKVDISKNSGGVLCNAIRAAVVVAALLMCAAAVKYRLGF